VSTRDRTLHPLVVRPRVSRRLVIFLALAHALALFAAAHASSRAAALLLCALILLHGAEAFRLHVLRRGPRAVHQIEHDGRGGWWLTTGGGERLEVRLAEARTVTHRLVVIGLHSGHRRWWLLLAADSAEADTLRRLRVVLRDAGSGQ
jgi:hypothetical protein